MSDAVYPAPTRELAVRRAELAPETHDAFAGVQQAGVRRRRAAREMKQLIAVAVAHVTQCSYCIWSHTRLAQRKGASEQEIMEAICGRDARERGLRALGDRA